LWLPQLDKSNMDGLFCTFLERVFRQFLGQRFAFEDCRLIEVAEVYTRERCSWIATEDSSDSLPGLWHSICRCLLGGIEVLYVVSGIALGVGFFEQASQLVALCTLSFFGGARCSPDIRGIEACRGV
jgi:hypothetical protein